MPAKPVKCNGDTNGEYCVELRDLPTLPAFITLLDPAGLPISAAPYIFPIGATFTYSAPSHQVSHEGTYCWNNLPPGKYSVEVKDSSATPCSIKADIIIEEPDSIGADYEVKNGLCGSTTAEVIATAYGGTGTKYKYTLTGVSYPATTNTNGIFKNVPIDNVNPYTLTVTDINGCTYTNIAVLVNSTNTLTAGIGITDVTCFGACNGKVNVIASNGVLPYRFVLESVPAGTFITSSDCVEDFCDNTYDFTGLCKGSYKLKVYDGNGCEYIYPTDIVIAEPAEIVVSGTATEHVSCNSCCDGKFTINGISGGVGPYSINVVHAPDGFVIPSTLFTDGLTPSVISALKPGNYLIEITDSSGCVKPLNVGINDAPDIKVAF